MAKALTYEQISDSIEEKKKDQSSDESVTHLSRRANLVTSKPASEVLAELDEWLVEVIYMKELPLEVLIEAVLFTSGRSMKIEELAELLGYPVDEVTLSVSQLQQTVKRRRNSALQLVEVGGRFAFEVKPSIANHLPSTTKPKYLQSYSKQPLLLPITNQCLNRLVELLGQKAYDHIRELAQSGLINRRKAGNTRRLTTTSRFSEVFGCPYTDRQKVKKWFREKVLETGMLDNIENASALEEEMDDSISHED